VYNVAKMLPRHSRVRQLSAFPGPLTNASATKPALLSFLDRASRDTPESGSHPTSDGPGSSSSAPATPATMTPRGQELASDTRFLWRTLQLLVEHNGKLSTDARAAARGSAPAPGTPGSPEHALATALMEDPQAMAAAAASNAGFTPRRLAQQQQQQQQPQQQQQSRNASLTAAAQQVEQLMLGGDKAAAVEAAVASQLWGHAILIASRADPATLQRVVQAFSAAELPPGSPLRAVYSLFAGDVANAAGGGGGATVANWRHNVAAMLSNRVPGNERALVALGTL